MNALVLALILLAVMLAIPIALLLSARDMVDTAAHIDADLAAVNHVLKDTSLTPDELHARLAQAFDDPAAPAHVAERAATAAQRATDGPPYLFQPGRVARGVGAAIAGGFALGACTLVPLVRVVLKTAPSPVVYVGLIGVCLVGLPATAGLLALYAQRRALRLDAEGIIVLSPFSRRRLPYTAVVQLTTHTHLSGTSARRRHYTLCGANGVAFFSWDWPDPAPAAAQDALFGLLVRLQAGVGKPMTVVDKG